MNPTLKATWAEDNIKLFCVGRIILTQFLLGAPKIPWEAEVHG